MVVNIGTENSQRDLEEGNVLLGKDKTECVNHSTSQQEEK